MVGCYLLESYAPIWSPFKFRRFFTSAIHSWLAALAVGIGDSASGAEGSMGSFKVDHRGLAMA